MSELATTRMSSKGQIVIPEVIRKKMNLQPGDQFIVVGKDDVVILKAITAPDITTFDKLIKQAREQAKMVNLNRKDIADAVSKARGGM
ncbi:MAG: AbrB/MazE/SpoVT family DNA-binding domain-containing protein [Anaerolineales bacterium]|nr:AbrB/MazE/SpoVT family DNA-binding domain-containing protein [Anaerolineales bacterium]